jgi:Tol biopolymer transport system component
MDNAKRILTGALCCLFLAIGCDNKANNPGNYPPSTPSDPNPLQGATDIQPSAQLHWYCVDPEGDSLFFDIYLDTVQAPSLVESNCYESYYQPTGLRYNTTYYWKIVARDSYGNQATGPVWSFSTVPLTGLEIAFVSWRDGSTRIFVMGQDGSNQRSITDGAMFDGTPSWSPGCAQLVYAHAGFYSSDICVINADGSNPHTISGELEHCGGPVWSRDGTMIAFTILSEQMLQIYLMNTDGSNPHNISNNNFSDYDPSWSPDGQKIAFASLREIPDQIYVMNSDGSNQHLILPDWMYGDEPAWSPDGTRIAFCGNGQIYTINVDGSGLQNISNSGVEDRNPCWSPDGAQIAFMSYRDGNYEIYVMNADGSNQHNISNNSAYDGEPDWCWAQ